MGALYLHLFLSMKNQRKQSFVNRKISSVYGKSSLSMKCPICELSYLWNVCLWNVFLWNVLSMKCPIFEIFFYEMSQRRNLIPLLCSYSIYTCNYVSYFFAVHKMIWNPNTLSCLYVGGGEGVYTLYITLKTFPRSLVKSEDDNPCSTSLLIDIPSSRLEHFNT